MSIKISISFLAIFFFVLSCSSLKTKFITEMLTKKDTLYIFFDENIERVKKNKMPMYKDHNPDYYWISYTMPVYWKQKNINNDDAYYFDGYFDHKFWYGRYKINPNFPEFDDSEIYGNSTILKKHKSFLKKKKYAIINYNWLKERTPPEVLSIFKPLKNKSDKPVLFLIDKSEFTNDSIILRNVIYHNEIIE